MKKSPQPPVYARVAYDIAVKVSAGEIKEGDRLSGRSLISSQYGVSSETVRRALQLLSDMGIVTVQANVGAVVTSRKQAIEYIAHDRIGQDLRTLRSELKSLLEHQRQINEQINSVVGEISDLGNRIRPEDAIRTYEFELQENHLITGKSIDQLCFRQKSGANIVAVRRGEEVFLSPNPQMQLLPEDKLIIACELSALSQAASFINQEK